MPLSADEPPCPKFQPNIFDPSRCHDCLRQRRLHAGTGESTEEAPRLKSTAGTGTGGLTDTGTWTGTRTGAGGLTDTGTWAGGLTDTGTWTGTRTGAGGLTDTGTWTGTRTGAGGLTDTGTWAGGLTDIGTWTGTRTGAGKGVLLTPIQSQAEEKDTSSKVRKRRVRSDGSELM